MDIKLTVAENLRSIRESRKLSLDSAAQLTGVSKSMLGQIERAEVNPTISVVWKIANGLRVSFTSLIEPPPADFQLHRHAEAAPLLADGGRYQNYPVFTYDEGAGFEQYRIVMEPSCQYDAQPHMAGTEEYIIVYKGSIVVTVDSAEFRLEKGDGLRFRADVAHCYDNRAAETAEISMVIRYKEM